MPVIPTKYKNKVPVFFTVDDNYVPYLSITLKSLVDHSKKTNKYDIYIIFDALSQQSKRIIRNVIGKRENFTLHFSNISLRISQLIEFKLDIRDYYTSSTYYRLFLPEIFPLVKKAIYIDSDIVLRSDIANLFAINLEDKVVGAVPDQSVQLFPEFATYVNSVIGMDHKEYFNAGVLLMDFKKLREIQLQKKSLELLRNVSFKVAQDQDVLNYLLKGKVKLLDKRWNVMPLGEVIESPYLIHYNLIFKPWKHHDIMYEDYFWDVADRLNIGIILKGQLRLVPEEYLQKDFEGVEMVKKMCLEEAKKANTFYAYLRDNSVKKEEVNVNILDEKTYDNVVVPTHNIKREEILAKIEELEKEGKFDVDVEDDPPYKPIEPHGLDFLRKKLKNKIKSAIANHYSFRYFNHKIKKGDIVIDGYEGIENLRKLKTGAVITANHFSPFDSIPLHKVVKKYSHKKLFKIIKEGNWSFPGLYGYFMRNCNSIPLSSNLEVLKKTFDAIDTVLTRGDLLLIYPEQSMWWNYRKPKPLKIGGFRFASKNNVPVLPTFITMRDTDKLDPDGYPSQAYTLHILEPIYPDPSLTIKENTKNLLEANERAWKEVYEKVYNKPLEYLK